MIQIRCSQAPPAVAGKQTVGGGVGSRETREAADAWSRRDLRVDRTRVVLATVALTGRRSLPHQPLLACEWKPRGRAATGVFGRLEGVLAEALLSTKTCAEVVRPFKYLNLVSKPTLIPHL